MKNVNVKQSTRIYIYWLQDQQVPFCWNPLKKKFSYNGDPGLFANQTKRFIFWKWLGCFGLHFLFVYCLTMHTLGTVSIYMYIHCICLLHAAFSYRLHFLWECAALMLLVVVVMMMVIIMTMKPWLAFILSDVIGAFASRDLAWLPPSEARNGLEWKRPGGTDLCAVPH